MIKERTPVTLQEVNAVLEKVKETEKSKKIQDFIKKFSELSLEKSKKLKEDLKALDIIKIKENDIINIVDFLPENAVELNKITTEANLDGDETNKILETVKKYK